VSDSKSSAAVTAVDWPRHLARLSMLAFVVSFLIRVTYLQLAGRNNALGSYERFSDGLQLSLILCGFVVGLIALSLSTWRRNWDVAVMAGIGLFFNGAVLALVVLLPMLRR
jgi:ABC-type transport system involved in multi-copper enzyme maturation permease subunit